MEYSINIDWQEEFRRDYDKWENLGLQMAERSCTHFKEDANEDDRSTSNMEYSGYCDECGHGEDSCQPMMNYAYALDIEPSEEAIKKVIENTNLTVMYNTETEEHFLVLTGGGMDLSQDIALAYYYCQRWMPEELLRNVCTQKDLSVSGENWKLLRGEMIYQSEMMENRGKQLKETWKETKE